MREQTLRFQTEDGFALSGDLYEPGQAPRAAVLINGATGVPRAYYAAFARHLCGRGLAVLSYDYRGMGDSAAAPGQEAALSMRAWGEQDTAAAIELLAQRYPALPLLLVGHSVGGQLLGLAGNNQRIRASYCIASQSGYWRHWPRRLQPLMAATWFLAVPLSLRLLGHLPPQFAGQTLPAGIAREWRRWCTHPDFIVDAEGRPLREGFARYRGALRMVHISDDERFAPRASVAALAAFYTGTRAELCQLRPADFGLRRIGHFGFFRRGMPAAAWEAVADWLLQEARAPLARAA